MTRKPNQNWAKDHWIKFETSAEHAERVERAEHQGFGLFQSATVRQKATYDQTMASLRGLDAPKYDRARTAANREWARSTAEAADLLTITCEDILRDGDVSEETHAEWGALAKREDVSEVMQAAE